MIDVEDLDKHGFPNTLVSNVIFEVPQDQWDMNFRKLDKPFFEYYGEVVIEDKRKEEVDEYNSQHVNEIIEEIICVQDNKCFITRNYYNERVISLVHVIKNQLGEEKLRMWAPTFDEIFDTFKKDDYNSHVHLKIMEEVCDSIMRRNKKKVHDIVQAYNPYVPDENWEIARFPFDSINFHPTVFHALLKQIMISEGQIYNKPHQDGAKRPVKAYRDLVINKLSRWEWERKYKL